ncbi:MAG: hypothetical protein P8X51_18060 [Maritimibacter sp.]
MTRVIVHAGFHKTGTTSLQSFLKRNTDALAPYAAIYLQRALKRARYLGRIYGQRPVFWRRWMFRRGFREFLASIPDAPTIVISRESFSGMMLGYRGARLRRCRRYASMAIPLAREIIRELRRRFGPEVEIEFLYTTREGESFLKSTWGHVLAPALVPCRIWKPKRARLPRPSRLSRFSSPRWKALARIASARPARFWICSTCPPRWRPS